MIAFRDFKPAIPGIFPRAGQVEENRRAALDEANAWIVAGSIDVINVETIGHHESAFEVQTIRIWYRIAGPKPQPSPEV